MGNLAITLWSQADVAGARELQEQVLAVRRLVLGEEHPDTLRSMSNLAFTLWNCGDHEQAIELIALSVESTAAKLGDDHPDIVDRAASLAQMRAALVDSNLRPADPT